jgi:hypothetical protein
MAKKYSREELISGMEMYYIIARNEPTRFETITKKDSISDAAYRTVDYLLKLINDSKS